MRKKPRDSLVLTPFTVGLLRTPGKFLKRRDTWGHSLYSKGMCFLPACIWLELMPPCRATYVAGLWASWAGRLPLHSGTQN